MKIKFESRGKLDGTQQPDGIRNETDGNCGKSSREDQTSSNHKFASNVENDQSDKTPQRPVPIKTFSTSDFDKPCVLTNSTPEEVQYFTTCKSIYGPMPFVALATKLFANHTLENDDLEGLVGSIPDCKIVIAKVSTQYLHDYRTIVHGNGTTAYYVFGHLNAQNVCEYYRVSSNQQETGWTVAKGISINPKSEPNLTFVQELWKSIASLCDVKRVKPLSGKLYNALEMSLPTPSQDHGFRKYMFETLHIVSFSPLIDCIGWAKWRSVNVLIVERSKSFLCMVHTPKVYATGAPLSRDKMVLILVEKRQENHLYYTLDERVGNRTMFDFNANGNTGCFTGSFQGCCISIRV
jgi:hypothetical protein